jgi:hypothetical protein
MLRTERIVQPPYNRASTPHKSTMSSSEFMGYPSSN